VGQREASAKIRLFGHSFPPDFESSF
jgi:hypothetical protein